MNAINHQMTQMGKGFHYSRRKENKTLTSHYLMSAILCFSSALLEITRSEPNLK